MTNSNLRSCSLKMTDWSACLGWNGEVRIVSVTFMCGTEELKSVFESPARKVTIDKYTKILKT